MLLLQPFIVELHLNVRREKDTGTSGPLFQLGCQVQKAGQKGAERALRKAFYELARDVLHDGFITLFSKLSDYRGEGMFEGWARRIFVTACLMQLRKTDILKQAVQIDGESSKAEATLELDPEETAQMDADKLMEMIVSMPDGFRTVFNLYAIEGFSHKEISKMLNLSEGGCRSQLSRARAWLQERISKLNSSKEKAK